MIFGFPGFEEFGHTGETTSNVLGLGCLTRRLGQNGSGSNVLAFLDDEVGARWNGVAGEHFLGLLVHDDDLRVQVFFVFKDDKGVAAFIGGFTKRDALDHVPEVNATFLLRNNGDGVLFPSDERFALLDLGSISNVNDGSDDEFVSFDFLAVIVVNGQAAVLGEHNPVAIDTFNGPQIVVANGAAGFDFDDWLFKRTGCSSARVERPHGELRSWFTDGLGSNNADRFTNVDAITRAEMQAVTGGTATALAFAGEHGADLHLLYADLHEADGLLLGYDIASLDDGFLRDWILDGLARSASVDPGLEVHDFFVTFVNGADVNAVGGSAILLGYDDVLGHIDELPRHVTGVSGLQSRIGQTLTSTVGGDEVFQNGQTLTEIGGNRAFDNFTGGLGHQAAHPAQLLNLLLVTTSTGGDHEVERIGVLLAFVELEGAEEVAGDVFGSVGPQIDDHVMALAIRDDTAFELFLDFLKADVAASQFVFLFHRDNHVGNTDGNPGHHSGGEAQGLHAVQRQHRFLTAGNLPAAPDDVGEFLLGTGLVDEAHGVRPDVIETHASWRGLDDALFLVAKEGCPCPCQGSCKGWSGAAPRRFPAGQIRFLRGSRRAACGPRLCPC